MGNPVVAAVRTAQAVAKFRCVAGEMKGSRSDDGQEMRLGFPKDLYYKEQEMKGGKN